MAFDFTPIMSLPKRLGSALSSINPISFSGPTAAGGSPGGAPWAGAGAEAVMHGPKSIPISSAPSGPPPLPREGLDRSRLGDLLQYMGEQKVPEVRSAGEAFIEAANLGLKGYFAGEKLRGDAERERTQAASLARILSGGDEKTEAGLRDYLSAGGELTSDIIEMIGGGWVPATDEDMMALGLDPAKMREEGRAIVIHPTKGYKELSGAGGTSVDVSVGDGVDLATPKFGEDYERNPDGSVKFGEDGRPRIVEVPGGEVERERLAEEAKGGERDMRAMRDYIIAQENVDYAIKAIEENPGLTTSLVGFGTKDLAGSPAFNVAQALLPLEGMIIRSTLQEIRDNKTGGGLGSVSNFESQMMASGYGSLAQGQDPGQLLHNLKRFKAMFGLVTGGRLVSGKFEPPFADIQKRYEAGDIGFEEAYDLAMKEVDKEMFVSGTDAPPHVDDRTKRLWPVLSPEERRLFIEP